MISIIKSTFLKLLLKSNNKIGKKFVYQGVDERRFWDGEKVVSPSLNVPFFENSGKQSYVITAKKESRDSVWLNAGEKFSLVISANPQQKRTKLSFLTEVDQTVKDTVEVEVGNNKVASLSGISPGRWHTVVLPLKEGENFFEIYNRAQSRVAFAHPILETVADKEVSGVEKKPQNVIMILLDSVWRDCLSFYNPAQSRYTPNINKFFKNSQIYNNCYSQSEWTLPSLYSLLMSKPAVEHGMTDLRSEFVGVSSEVKDNLPLNFKKLGYSTFAFSTVKIFQPGFWGHLGFDRFLFYKFPQPDQTNNLICQKAIEQLQSNVDGKNFLFLHFLDTHEPWSHTDYLEDTQLSNFRIADAEKEFNFYKKGENDSKLEIVYGQDGVEVLSNRRNARLFSLDLALGNLFNYLASAGLSESTVVTLFSDHGYQYLGQNRPLLCDSRLRVPLLIQDPGRSAAVNNDLVCLNLDLGPTLAKMVGGKFGGDNGGILGPFGNNHRTEVISESIFGQKYKAAVINKEYVLHFSCDYNKKTREILFDKMVSEKLFKIEDEFTALNLDESTDVIFKDMKKILYNYLNNFSFKRGI